MLVSVRLLRLIKCFKRGFAVCGRKSCRLWPKLSPHSPSPLPRRSDLQTKTETCLPAAAGILASSKPCSAETKHINYRIDRLLGACDIRNWLTFSSRNWVLFVPAGPAGISAHIPVRRSKVGSRLRACNSKFMAEAQLVWFRWALEYLSGEGEMGEGYVDNENFPLSRELPPRAPPSTHIDTLWAKQYLG